MIHATENLQLEKMYAQDDWRLMWPGDKTPLVVLTHDEIFRLGLKDQLARRTGSIPVVLIILERESRDYRPHKKCHC